MSTYPQDTAETVKQAKAWAADAAARNLDTYVRMIDRSMDGSYTADQMAADWTSLWIGMQQDAARAFTTWSQLLTGLTK